MPEVAMPDAIMFDQVRLDEITLDELGLALACHSRAGGNPGTSAFRVTGPVKRHKQSHWVPACAGMTIKNNSNGSDDRNNSSNSSNSRRINSRRINSRKNNGNGITNSRPTRHGT